MLGRTWVSGIGQDKAPRPEIEWHLQAVPNPDPVAWPEVVSEALADSATTTDDDPGSVEALPGMSYSQLVARVEARGQARRPSGVVRTDYPRSMAARRAVLERSLGTCESPRYTGMPPETNRRGQPILDVDHIKDLALGGEDHPTNMVALCPNCHAAKTRGAHPGRWRTELLRVAKAAHEAALNSS